SFCDCDEEGRPLSPSPFVDEVRALFSAALWERRRLRRLHEPAWPMAEAPTGRELARARAATGERAPERPLGPATGAAAGEAAAAGAARRVQADVRRLLQREAAVGGPLVPTHLELAFGFEEEDPDSLPPLDISNGVASLRLRGRIDRVDLDPATNAALVRDYKVGRAEPAYRGAQWAEQRRLQVALYMLAVSER